MDTNTAGSGETELMDTGDFLEVPEGERLAVDDYPEDEVNDDEFDDLGDVPYGEPVVLSTAHLDEDD